MERRSIVHSFRRLALGAALIASLTRGPIEAEEPEFRLGGIASWERDESSRERSTRPPKTVASSAESAAKPAHFDAKKSWTYSVTPPPGLRRLRGKLPEGLVDVYRAPAQKVSFTVARFTTVEPVGRFARRTLTGYTTTLDRFNIRQLGEGDGSRTSFMVELDTRVADSRMRQIQVYERVGRSILVLTYTAPTRQWDDHLRFFRRSIESLEITAKDADDEQRTGTEAQNPGRTRPSEVSETLRGLLDGLRGR